MNRKPYIETAPLHQGSTPIETIKAQYGLVELARLSSNENPLGPSPKAIAAAQAVLAGLNYYPDFTDTSLRDALAQHIGRGLTADNFVTGNSGCDVLTMVGHCFLREGDAYIISRPTFPVYENSNRKVGAVPIYVDLDPHDFSYNVEAILAAITDRTRLIYVCNPNNPTGNIMPIAQMERLVSSLPADVLLVTDEVYYHYVTATDYPDSIRYIQQNKNVLIVHSFSKVYGLAGMRLGYGIAPVAIAQYIARFRQPYQINQLSLQAGIAALGDTEHVEKTVRLAHEEKVWLQDKLAEMDMPTWPSEANFILFRPPLEAAFVSEELLKRGAMVRPMTGFYLPTHLRVSIGLPEENRRFIGALREVLRLA